MNPEISGFGHNPSKIPTKATFIRLNSKTIHKKIAKILLTFLNCWNR